MLFEPVALFSLKELIMLLMSSFVLKVRKREFVFNLLMYMSNALFVLGTLFTIFFLVIEVEKVLKWFAIRLSRLCLT